MDAQTAMDWVREAILMTAILAAPALLAALITGLIVSALQTMIQLHDPAVGTVPRLLVVSAVLLATMPWLMSRWIDYAQNLIQSIPGSL